MTKKGTKPKTDSSLVSETLEDELLVKYEVFFPKTPPLLGGAIDDSNDSPSGVAWFGGISESLIDEIEWEPHVDKADRLDYIVAVSSGVLAGLVDVFYVGEFSLDRASEWGNSKIERVVMKVARAEGYTGDDLSDAIKTLEKNHPFAADGNTNDFGGGLQHHFRDFSHHFSIGGLFFSILTQFTGMVVGADNAGRLTVKPVPESHRQFIGKNFQEKLAYGVIGWFFHMVSDMAGSSGATMGGTGVPGPLVSFMKELSALPFFKDSGKGDYGFRQWLTKLFNGTLLSDHDESGKIIKDSARRFDLRAEIGILGEIGRQTVPILINQCIVRGFYFCRRICREIRDLDIRELSDLDRIAPEDVLPWGTPAMRRMVTVSSGVFTGVDLADAAVRAAKSKNPVAFFLRVNYVGVATFVISCVVDARATLADNAKEEGESPEEAFDRGLSNLGCLKLDFQQTRVLHSIMHNMVAYDIANEKRDKRVARKQAWLDEWSAKVAEAMSLAWAANEGFFLNDGELYKVIGWSEASGWSDSWMWLVALEAACFKAYMPLHGGRDKEYKGLKLNANYLGDVFCRHQGTVSDKELKGLSNSVSGTRGKIDGAGAKKAVGAVGTVVAIAATGGLAFYFAPAIAPALAAALGAEVATLSGAALTSASLAFLGGGALAAGGAGMAGGAMLIAGGGALIGAVGGSSISAATNLTLATDTSYVLDECAKLVAFSREVLVAKYGDLAAVAEIHDSLSRRIIELEVQTEAIKRNMKEAPGEAGGEKEDSDDLSPEKMVKVLKRSIKFLKKSRDELGKLLDDAGKERLVLPQWANK
ncbi:hypothetical protein [Olsenella uli]|uniref:hypothetical protein n=1 Tax=Olsenella uli TaxID=133926 RepID=UPI0012AB79D1|nr:hypothetical protein [Olsenella uli]